MIELIMLVCAVGGAVGAIRNGRGGPKSADDIDREERQFMKSHGYKNPSSARRYLDWKRESIGMPRRPGVNADVIAPRNDTPYTIKPGEEW